ncbi:response regulator transcription factor [Sphingomonas aliaeris]|uniref:Response regulator transcription factor n=1 Tax=Sphingomonas aliaeris TaxID=2759526 RepID=A0A974S3K9_9SPHN|nr:response regulator transcription factor [Sphingomonas aliaeris]QQV76541.1 response regulator transcription factor [Sphingomonas aliaeris]
MTVCRECGAHSAQRVSRGPLTVQIDPDAAYWRGKLLPIVGYRLRILHLLCSRGRASHFAIAIAGSGPDSGASTVSVQISLLRRQLPKGVEIKPIRGFGYELTITEEHMNDLKQRASEHLDALPEDTLAYVVLSISADNKPQAFSTVDGMATFAILGRSIAGTAEFFAQNAKKAHAEEPEA